MLTGRPRFPLAALKMGVSGDDMASIKGNSGTRTDNTNYSRSDIMRMKLSYLTPLLGAAAAAVAISAAPIASAATVDPGADQQSCSGTVCESPGNTQINDSPPPVNFYPYGGDAFLLGGGGFGGHGGGHR